MEKKYQSEALMVNHQSAESLFRLGEISEAEMREFDEMCLVSPNAEQESTTVYNENNKNVNLEHTSHATA